MDNHYNVSGAGELDNYRRVHTETLQYVTTANQLGKFIEERQAFTTDQLTSFENVIIHSYVDDGADRHWFQVDLLKTVRNERPTYWRLVTPGLEVTEVEELVLSLQGVIASKDLLPVLKR